MAAGGAAALACRGAAVRCARTDTRPAPSGRRAAGPPATRAGAPAAHRPAGRDGSRPPVVEGRQIGAGEESVAFARASVHDDVAATPFDAGPAAHVAALSVAPRRDGGGPVPAASLPLAPGRDAGAPTPAVPPWRGDVGSAPRTEPVALPTELGSAPPAEEQSNPPEARPSVPAARYDGAFRRARLGRPIAHDRGHRPPPPAAEPVRRRLATAPLRLVPDADPVPAARPRPPFAARRTARHRPEPETQLPLAREARPESPAGPAQCGRCPSLRSSRPGQCRGPILRRPRPPPPPVRPNFYRPQRLRCRRPRSRLLWSTPGTAPRLISRRSPTVCTVSWSSGSPASANGAGGE